MKLKLLGKDAKETGNIDLPLQFKEPLRKDIIKRAVIALQLNNRQPYGASPEAGKRASTYLSKRRRAYRGTYGIGQSRTPRKILSRRGTQIYYVGAFAPHTTGGRRAHPPKASKSWEKKVNEKENRKAIRSALAATVNAELVKKRGHKAPKEYPFIITDEFEKITKTKDLVKALEAIGFKEELERGNTTKIRAGKGKTRGRKHKTKKTMLFVVSQECDLEKAARNLPGADIAVINNVNAELLAPGAELGRLTLYTESAIKKLGEENLFTNTNKKKVVKKEKKKQAEEKPAKKKTTKKKAAKKKTVKKTVKKETEKAKAE